MSLAVWLPLNGNLNNQGLSNITLINNTANIDNNGKIGKCYNFSSGKSITYNLDISKFNSTAFSFSCWIYISSWNSSYDAILSIANGTGWNNSKATLCRNNIASTLTWNIANDSTSQRISSNTSISLNTWTHIATTYDGAKLRIYINGILDKEGAANLSIGYVSNFYLGTWNGGTSYPFNGKLNDVRIYDHCLSQKEIEEISKGLILHYKLDSIINNKIYDCSGYQNNGTIVGSLETTTQSPRYSCAIKFDGVTSCIKIPYNEINPNRIFTVNLWFYKDALGSKSYETLFGGPSGFEMDTRSGSSSTLSLYMASVRGGNAYSPLSLNKWTMITMVRDGTNEFYYVNGDLKKTIAAKSMPSGQYRIGAWASDTGQNYYGEISDFRIYATAFTSTQIKELYNTSATIDNQKNIYARELVEIE